MHRALRICAASLFVSAGVASAGPTRAEAWDAAKTLINSTTNGDVAALFADTPGVSQTSLKVTRVFPSSPSYTGQYSIGGLQFFNVLAYAYNKDYKGASPALDAMFGQINLPGGTAKTDPFGTAYTVEAEAFNAGSSADTYFGLVRYTKMYGISFDGGVIYDSKNCISNSSLGTANFGPGTYEPQALIRASSMADAFLGAVKAKIPLCNSMYKAITLSQASGLKAAYIYGINKLREDKKNPNDFLTFSPALAFLDSDPDGPDYVPPPGPGTGGTTQPPCVKNDGTSSGNPYDCAPTDNENNCSIINLPCNIKWAFIPRENFLMSELPQIFTKEWNMPTQVTDKIEVEIPLLGENVKMGLNFGSWVMNDVFQGLVKLMCAFSCFYWLLNFMGIPNPLGGSARGTGDIATGAGKARRIGFDLLNGGKGKK